VPLGRGVVGAILVENLMDVEDQAAAEDLLVGLLPALRPDGVVASSTRPSTRKPRRDWLPCSWQRP